MRDVTCAFILLLLTLYLAYFLLELLNYKEEQRDCISFPAQAETMMEEQPQEEMRVIKEIVNSRSSFSSRVSFEDLSP
jgi:hypothetical protein